VSLINTLLAGLENISSLGIAESQLQLLKPALCCDDHLQLPLVHGLAIPTIVGRVSYYVGNKVCIGLPYLEQHISIRKELLTISAGAVKESAIL